MFHFLNACLLTYAPLVLLYRTTPLKEESAYKSCFRAGMIYVFTQCIRFFIIASVLPLPDPKVFAPATEALYALVNVSELVGMSVALRGTDLAKFTTGWRIMAVTVGWCFAEALFSNLVPLWVGARGVEFSWTYVEMAVLTNVRLFTCCAAVTAMWLYARTDVSMISRMCVYVILCVYLILPGAGRFLTTMMTSLSLVQRVATLAAVSVTMAVVARGLLASYGAQRAAAAAAAASASSSSKKRK